MSVPTSGRARVQSDSVFLGDADAGGGVVIPIVGLLYVGIRGLPDPQEGVIYVVSGLVSAMANREDVVSPGRQHIVRENGDNKIVVCRSFVRQIAKRS